MKFAALMILMGAFSAHAVEVKGKLDNLTTKAAIVAVYTEYSAESSLPTCRNHGIPDGQYTSHAKTKQQVRLVKGHDLKAQIPQQFGLCKFTLTHMGVAVIDPKIVDIMKKNGAKEVEKDVLEFKGAFSGLIRLNKDVQRDNVLRCSWNEYGLTQCDAKEVYLNGNTLSLDIDLN